MSNPLRPTLSLVAVGAVVAVAFALLIDALPASTFEPGEARLALVLGLTALGAAPFAWLTATLTRRSGLPTATAALALLAGAGGFDGIAIAFAPDLYGLDGALRAGAAASLLFGLACVAVGAMGAVVLAERRSPASSPASSASPS